MKLELVGKNIDLTEALKDRASEKLSKIDKYFNEEVRARAVFSTQKNGQTVEVTIFLPGTILRAEETTQDMYESIDKVVDALSRQTRKYKTRLKRRYQDNSETIRFENIESLGEEASPEEGKIIRRKEFNLKPMMEEEAILQMELLNHNFYVFLNAETDRVEIVYKRKAKGYGSIVVSVED